MACHSCRKDILESAKWWGHHHVRTFGDHGQQQPVEKCIFCDALQHAQKRHKAESTRYIWTIVRRARTRESEESFTVTFRPVKGASTSAVSQKALDATRTGLDLTKTFYLIPWVESLHASKGIGATTGSEVAFDQMYDWVEHCNKNHRKCERRPIQDECEDPAPQDPSPKRLVYVGNDDGQIPYIVNVFDILQRPEHNGRMPPYCTLSYCWGPPEDILKTTMKSLERHMDPKIGLGNLEGQVTFKHVIAVTRRLKVEYVWIDALCIVQGDGGDFHSEGAKMHTIYRNTYCTIAAAASESSVGGLYRPRGRSVRDPSRITPVCVELDEPSKLPDANPWMILPADLWEDQLITNSPLYTRGWVVQERMLSPRIIHFAAEQLFWDCRSLSACEGFPQGLPGLLDTKSMTDREWRQRLQYKPGDKDDDNIGESLDTLWQSAVRHYTSCNLTNNADKFNAIWGLAKVVGDITCQKYPAGLWEVNMAEQLAWTVLEPQKAFRPKTLGRHPSWSWASVQGAVDLNSRLTEDWEKIATNHHGAVIACPVVPIDGDKQPELRHAALAIESSLVEVSLVHMSTVWTVIIDGERYKDKIDVVLDSLQSLSGRPTHHHHQHLDCADAWDPKHAKCFAMLLAGQPTYFELEEDEEDDQRWSGFGLILTVVHGLHSDGEPSDGTHFLRRGVFRFQNLEKKEWDIISTTLCPSLKAFEDCKGAKLWLE